MKIERNINKRLYNSQSLKGEIKYIFNSAIKNQTTHAKILSNIKARVYDKDKYKTLGVAGRAEIGGYIQANMDIMYNHIEWVFYYDDVFTKKLTYDENFDQSKVLGLYVYKDTQIAY